MSDSNILAISADPEKSVLKVNSLPLSLPLPSFSPLSYILYSSPYVIYYAFILFI